MVGIGLESGISKRSPFCNFRNRKPAFTLATAEKGGVFTSPRTQTSGLSFSDNFQYAEFDIYKQNRTLNIKLNIGEYFNQSANQAESFLPFPP
jgi:hypothetical protein